MSRHFLRRIYLKRYLYIILILGSSSFGAQTVTVTGNWAPTIAAITEAGTNYAGTYDNITPSNPITMSGTLPGSFLNLLSSNGAKITMHQATTVWNNSLVLSAKEPAAPLRSTDSVLPVPQRSMAVLLILLYHRARMSHL
ncbi:hypothetical protein H3Z85_05600 [Chryseobacterium indologenes]|nr:hypothetical protein H3Z85_05600 [Chryseobacterium indologenes]